MNNKVINDRLEKFKLIVSDYDNRMTQKDIAEKYNMKISDVARVTKKANYTHTRKISEESIRPGEKINPIISVDDLEFLDKYNFLAKK